jgi:hypothetical protein
MLRMSRIEHRSNENILNEIDDRREILKAVKTRR